jgi:4-oxalocrotonate tautomerase
VPYLNIKLSSARSAETSRAIAATLTDLTVELLKKRREVTAVAIEYVPAADWYVGGVALSAQAQHSFYLDIKVTEGTNTKDEKRRYVADVFSAMERLLGKLNPASYIVIHDVRGDAWGYQGQTQEFRYIQGKAP